MKRRLPDLSHVLTEQRPFPIIAAAATAAAPLEKRIHTRFDKAFVVVIGSELYGDAVAVARNISAGGLLVEMSYAPPLGTIVTVHFQHHGGNDKPDAVDEIVARAEVKHHHYLNFSGGNDAASSRAIGLRFIEFLDPGDRVDPERIH